MSEENSEKPKKKSFIAMLFEKLDKRMEEKAKSKPCCCKPEDKEGKSCCK